MDVGTLISHGYYVSSFGFLVATPITALVASKFGKSSLRSFFSY